MTSRPTPAKPRGRPRNAEPYTRVTAWVPVALHLRLQTVATRHDLSVSATVRQLLTKRT